MGLSIRAPKDFWTGAIYSLAGLAGYVVSRDYPFGSSARMGPGYFPFVISALLVLVGAIAIVRSFRIEGDPVGRLALKPMALITASVLSFAFLVNTAGLLVAMAVSILVGASASERFRFEWKALIGMAVMVAFCALVFVRGLGVPMPLVGPWISGIVPGWSGF
ncbi:tripartite tricarboxylate transporter TctB family protein [Aureimonas sp. Leaf324]|uniref:tripartite tricarboxylate transporter TctB family protein n=1 Tax=Aureimonas sp. Leaf324 TaxID=1736336 RepID=UPI0012E2FD14|nr:tripartite tricarboxylate transporter TctB family protein [Aureimonas sp. Leaf324]